MDSTEKVTEWRCPECTGHAWLCGVCKHPVGWCTCASEPFPDRPDTRCPTCQGAGVIKEK